jgi:hypothetical protein
MIQKSDGNETILGPGVDVHFVGIIGANSRGSPLNPRITVERTKRTMAD